MSGRFLIDHRPDGVAVLTFDQPGRPLNTLGRDALEELARVAGDLAARPGVTGLLFRSGKLGSFVAGADLKEIAALADSDPSDRGRLIDRGLTAFGAMAALPFPTVALIDGPCLGGGLELALAFDDRIASDSPKTRLGLPEVKLGLTPCWGGTQRLPRLIGLPAIEIAAHGEPLDAGSAATVGLVHDLVSPDELLDAGLARLASLREGDAWLARRARANAPIDAGPHVLAAAIEAAERAVRSRSREPEPVGLLVVEAIRRGATGTLAEGLEAERVAGLAVLGSPRATNLIGLFFLRTRASRGPVAGLDSAPPIRGVGVLGAGQMGAGIAAAVARAGLPVVMVDVDEASVARGLDRIREEETRRVKSGRASAEELGGLLERLETATTASAFADRDLLIEAVPEDEALKRRVLSAMARDLPADAILATNTTSLSIDLLAEAAPDAHRFLGMHFFHPVERMELVEVVRGGQTHDRAVATAVGLARRLGKVPVVVRDGPGFLVSRVLFPYLSEAILMVEQGAHIDEVDAAALAFGMPMGPVALTDLIGLDTVAAAGHVLARAFPERALAVPLLDAMVTAGRLGRKSGAGFWKYASARAEAQPDPSLLPLLETFRESGRSFDRDEITDRLILVMLAEAARALDEGIARDAGDLDLAMVLGIGFPSWLGGPLRWADAQPTGALLRRLGELERLGPRFRPSGALATGGRFHGPAGDGG